MRVAGTSAYDYQMLSGTSMAAAVTRAMAARVLQANRANNGPADVRLSPNAVKAVLQHTATRQRASGGT